MLFAAANAYSDMIVFWPTFLSKNALPGMDLLDESRTPKATGILNRFFFLSEMSERSAVAVRGCDQGKLGGDQHGCEIGLQIRIANR